MDRDHLDLVPKVAVIAPGSDSLYMAQNLVIGCEECDAAADRPFSTVLDQITRRQDCVTDYILCEAAKCGRCGAPIIESTLVVLKKTGSETIESEPLYFGVPVENTNIVLVEERTLSEAEEWIASCEHCDENCEYSFDQILDALTECDPTNTEYVICREAKCPHCNSCVTEKTLVGPVY